MALTASPPADTQARRRVKYGLNVGIAAAAAVVLACLLNWIGYRQFVRWDLTATRKYSLSDQTRKILDQLEDDYSIVTLLPPVRSVIDPRQASVIQQAIDLTNEYDRRSSRLSAEHLNPGADITRVESLYESLKGRYDEELVPLKEAIRHSRTVMDKVRVATAQWIEPLNKLIEEPQLAEGELKLFTQSIVNAFARIGSDLESIDRRVDRTLQTSLPDYDGAKSTLGRLLDDLDNRLLELAISRFRKDSTLAETPDAVKEKLLSLISQFGPLLKDVKAAKQKLDEANSVTDYDRLSGQLAAAETVLVMGPSQVQVIAFSDLFRMPDPRQMQTGQMPELRFQGEEKITGALVSMSMDSPPMVVFVGGGQRPAIGPGGIYQKVAQRLQTINFKVEQWNPSGGPMGPMGKPVPPGPPPQPAEGQNVVWVVLPSPPPNPRNPMAAAGAHQVAAAVERQMSRGDGVMFLLSFNPMPFMGGGDGIAKLFEPWGITAQTDRAILTEVSGPDRQVFPDSRFDLVSWPDGSPITAAIDGMKGHFEVPCPLLLAKPDQEKTRIVPLIEIRGRRLWAATDLTTNQQPEYDASTAADSFVIGAAAEKDDSRIIVTTCGHDPQFGYRSWASDLTTDVGGFGGRPVAGAADMLGALWPANAELFVNGVIWLAGLDELIAAGARAQDIRRIEIDVDSIGPLRWTLAAGLPLATFCAGIGVWGTRRKG